METIFSFVQLKKKLHREDGGRRVVAAHKIWVYALFLFLRKQMQLFGSCVAQWPIFRRFDDELLNYPLVWRTTGVRYERMIFTHKLSIATAIAVFKWYQESISRDIFRQNECSVVGGNASIIQNAHGLCDCLLELLGCF